jgi:hypothetical protein
MAARPPHRGWQLNCLGCWRPRSTLEVLFALIALSVIAGSASVLDAKTFFEQIDRDHN